MHPTIIELVDEDPEPEPVVKSKKGSTPVTPVVLYGVKGIVHSFYSPPKG